jgi:hypothetical protein
MRSIRSMTVATLLIGMSLPAAAADRPAFSALPREFQELFVAWQRQDCRNDDGKLTEEMIAAGAVLEDAFWEAYELGPAPSDLEELTSTLSDRWQLRQRWLKANDEKAIAPELTEQLLSQSEEDFRLDEEAKLAQRWRDAALSGLGRVCTARSIDRLKSIAFDEKDPSSIAARTALKTSDECSAKE